MFRKKQQVESQIPVAQSKRKRSAKRYTIHLVLLFIFLTASGITLCLTEFFLVASIQVEGNDRYSNSEVIEVSGIYLEDNLFRIDTKGAVQKIYDRYPYFETVKVKRSLPESVVIQVTMAQPMMALETDNGYVLVSDKGKILETGVEEADESILRVRGLGDWEYQVGSFITDTLADEEGAKILAESYRMLEEFSKAEEIVQLGNINYLDLSDRYNICALYDDRILLEFGSEANLVYKLNFISEMLKENIPRDFGADFEGLIDASFDKQLRVRPMDLSMILDDQALAGDLAKARGIDEQTYSVEMQPMVIPVRLDEDSSTEEKNTEEEAVFESSIKPKEE